MKIPKALLVSVGLIAFARGGWAIQYQIAPLDLQLL